MLSSAAVKIDSTDYAYKCAHLHYKDMLTSMHHITCFTCPSYSMSFFNDYLFILFSLNVFLERYAWVILLHTYNSWKTIITKNCRDERAKYLLQNQQFMQGINIPVLYVIFVLEEFLRSFHFYFIKLNVICKYKLHGLCTKIHVCHGHTT